MKYYLDRFDIKRSPRVLYEQTVSLGECNLDFNDYHHINDGETGKWRTVFSVEEQEQIMNNESIVRWLQENNYVEFYNL